MHLSIYLSGSVDTVRLANGNGNYIEAGAAVRWEASVPAPES